MESPREFVDRFARFWARPSLDGFAKVLAPTVTLRQPMAPTMHGLEQVRAGFKPVFDWLPDIHGEVDRWTAEGDVVFIEFRLRATIGGRPFEWPLIDRFVVGPDGMAIERLTYFDPLPLVLAILARPSGWWRFWRSGAAGAVLRA
jgi:hypothetical protein